MDTTTVLEIIKMIDNKLTETEHLASDAGTELRKIGAEIKVLETLQYLEDFQKRPLLELKGHLQSFIEGQLSSAENISPE